MNKVILIGRLCADPETRTTQSGTTVASYRLAVDRAIKTEGQPEADFIGCVTFGKSADFASRYFNKGMKIAVEGRIQTRNYDDKDGKKVYVTEIIIERQEFCEKKESGNSFPAPNVVPAPNGVEYSEVYEDSDLPF